VEVSDTTLA